MVSTTNNDRDGSAILSRRLGAALAELLNRGKRITRPRAVSSKVAQKNPSQNGFSKTPIRFSGRGLAGPAAAPFKGGAGWGASFPVSEKRGVGI